MSESFEGWLDRVGDVVACEELRAARQLTLRSAAAILLTQFSEDEMTVLEGMYGRGLAVQAAGEAIVAWRG